MNFLILYTVFSVAVVVSFAIPTINPTLIPTASPTSPQSSNPSTNPKTNPAISPSPIHSTTPVQSTSPISSPTLSTAIYFSFDASSASGTTLLNNGGGGSSFDAKLVNGASISTAAHPAVGSASLQLDGSTSQYVQVPSFTTGSEGLTFAFWFQTSSNSDWARILDFGNGRYADNISVQIKSGALGIFVSMDGCFKFYEAVVPHVNDNVWRHFAWTLTPDGSWTVYMNGVSVWSAKGQLYPSIKTFENDYLGKSNWNGEPYFTGAISSFRMYNAVLSASDVMALTTLSPKSPTTSPTMSTAIYYANPTAIPSSHLAATRKPRVVRRKYVSRSPNFGPHKKTKKVTQFPTIA